MLPLDTFSVYGHTRSRLWCPNGAKPSDEHFRELFESAEATGYYHRAFTYFHKSNNMRENLVSVMTVEEGDLS